MVGDFFVVRAARRKQVGQPAALQLFGLHPGHWEIAFQEDNAGAARFWRRVGAAAAGLMYREEAGQSRASRRFHRHLAAPEDVTAHGPPGRIRQDGPVTEHAERPWGTYTVIAEADGFKVETIEVRPGQRLSYQRHTRRSEHSFVGEGNVGTGCGAGGCGDGYGSGTIPCAPRGNLARVSAGMFRCAETSLGGRWASQLASETSS